MHRADLIAVHTTHEGDAFARLRALSDDHRHIPVLSCHHLHPLEVEEVLPAGLQVVNVQRADDLLPPDHIASIDRSLGHCRSRARERWRCALGVGSARLGRDGRRGDGRDHEIPSINADTGFF